MTIDMVRLWNRPSRQEQNFVRLRKSSLLNNPGAPILYWLKTLADACRLGIVLLLWRKGEVCVTEIVKAFEVGQPTVSHHLAILRDAGLVNARHEGKQTFYSLNQERVAFCCGQLMITFAPEEEITETVKKAVEA
jgi:DNA-binding transcriptional ArsR family regulator